MLQQIKLLILAHVSPFPQIGNKPVDNLTYAEVVEILHSYTHSGEQCILSLHHNMDGEHVTVM